jgi:hypothetical protein
MKYRCYLLNEQCAFDEGTFNCSKDIKDWAKGRGEQYTLYVYNATGFLLLHRIVKKDRFFKDPNFEASKPKNSKNI